MLSLSLTYSLLTDGHQESIGNLSNQIRELLRKIGITPNYISKRRKKWHQKIYEDFIEINFCNEEEATRALEWWNGHTLGSFLQSIPVLENPEGCSAKILGYCVQVNHDLEHCQCKNCLEFRSLFGIGEFEGNEPTPVIWDWRI